MIKNLLPGFLLVAMVLVYGSCKKEASAAAQNTGTTPTPSSLYYLNIPDSADQNDSINGWLNVDEMTTGQVVPTDFLGFSFEKKIVTDTTYLNASNTTFTNMFKNLGNGLIRIGGASVDQTFWSNGRRTGAVTDTVYTNDVSRFKAFAQSVGWKTIWGLNLGTGTPANDADEAKYVSANMGSQIASFAIGNEPAYLPQIGLRQPGYNQSQYVNEFNNFSTAITTSLPNVIFSGPENEEAIWGLSFMQNISSQLNMLTIHYYRMGPAGDASVTMNKLMTLDPALQAITSAAATEGQTMKLPYRISECNSVYNGGEAGMSNAYAASLWGTEFLFYTAQQGAAGINFHTQGTPDCIYSAISTVNRKSVARPLYYAMLLFHQANIKQFTSNEISTQLGLNVDAFSFITRDNKKGIMIINKYNSVDAIMTINTANLIQTATVYQLTGPALSSLTGTSINGSMVNADGTFLVNGQQFNVAKKYSSLQVKVKPISAMLILLN